ncbi:LCP family protein [Wukongibacter sp. M2B1]|uniref:LCP family protein n=1 Tax=Wukongibacter sp. M2B1 TaxID=3088895 RepID=UPI003D790862
MINILKGDFLEAHKENYIYEQPKEIYNFLYVMKKKKIVLIILLILMISAIFRFYYRPNVNVFNTNYIEIVDSIPRSKDINAILHKNKEKIANKKRIDEENLKKINKNDNEDKIEHILLVGIDSRRNDFKYARADSIIIASINKATSQIKLTSIMRDTYVKIPRHKNNRINAAYAYGGAKLLKETINRNFNLNIEKYIVINFRGFKKVIDILGGLDVNLKKYEVNELNRCIVGLGGSRSQFVKQSGLRHLNGEQALAYCRIRKVGKGDYERTGRQRTVVKLIIEKVKELSFSEYPKLIASMYPYVKTNISNGECLKLIYRYYNVEDWSVASIQIPTS